MAAAPRRQRPQTPAGDALPLWGAGAAVSGLPGSRRRRRRSRCCVAAHQCIAVLLRPLHAAQRLCCQYALLAAFGSLTFVDSDVIPPTGYTQLFGEAVERLQALGGNPVNIDFSPFAEVTHTASLLRSVVQHSQAKYIHASHAPGQLPVGHISFTAAARSVTDPRGQLIVSDFSPQSAGGVNVVWHVLCGSAVCRHP